jgi:hypothetical protein
MQSNAWRGSPMPQGSKVEFSGEPRRLVFLNCGENGPDDILKFP